MGVDAQLLYSVNNKWCAMDCFKVVVGSFSIACYNNFLDVAERAGISGVINSRLSKVITPSGLVAQK